jgi:8-oxo-dGTP pyrophosphatase MutT (NUDIX family)
MRTPYRKQRRSGITAIERQQPWYPLPQPLGHIRGPDRETPDRAIAREIKEELEYELSDPEYFGNFPFDGYDIYMYRIVDHNLALENLTVKEGRKGRFFSLEEVKEVACAFNCREIVIAYFNMFHFTNISPGK